eukprot:15438026-Alexandrium_andersonii.AAC.1
MPRFRCSLTGEGSLGRGQELGATALGQGSPRPSLSLLLSPKAPRGKWGPQDRAGEERAGGGDNWCRGSRARQAIAQ